MNEISHWKLQIADTTRHYKSTIDINVLAPEMIDAINRVQELYPNARIYDCIHKGTFKNELYIRPKNKFTIQKWVKIFNLTNGNTIQTKLFNTKEEAELYDNSVASSDCTSQVFCIDWKII